MIDLHTLNDNQLQAVEWRDGPLPVLAGPGSGKTCVLTYRIARLIESTPDKFFKILALTFTNAAAAQMRDRLSLLIPNASDRTLLTTFHSFAADILRQHGSHIGLRPDFTMLVDDMDRHSLLDEAIRKRSVRSSVTDWKSEKLLPLISRLTENGVRPEQALNVLSNSATDTPDELADIYVTYRKLMIDQHALDFPVLIAETIDLVKSEVGVQKQIRKVYPYICVDEFQDTNRAQAELLELLVDPVKRNLFVVADDDQIIY